MAQRPENHKEGRPYEPRPTARGPRPHTQGPRPQLWKSGPNIKDHEQYQAWLVHKAQANFRGEAHELSYEDFRDAWNRDGNWELRGRASGNICMYRIDTAKPWSAKNIEFDERKNYLARANAAKKGQKYRKRNKSNE